MPVDPAAQAAADAYVVAWDAYQVTQAALATATTTDAAAAEALATANGNLRSAAGDGGTFLVATADPDIFQAVFVQANGTVTVTQAEVPA